MELQMRPLPFDPARLHGLSERIVASHHANNYGGAVRRYNALRARWSALRVAEAPGFELNGLKREELIAANSTVLHGLHFENLGGDGALADGPLKTVLAQGFGSFDAWRDEFMAMGRALAGGSGWVLLAWCPRAARLVNQWAADHAHALAGAEPLVALDMYEHAYHLDFGANAAAWVDAFMRNLHWERSARRVATAGAGGPPPPHAPPAPPTPPARRFAPAGARATATLEASPAELAGDPARWQWIDVRRRPVFEAATHCIGGARWFEPEQPAQLAGALLRERPVAVYCVHGHAISRSVAAQLAAAGFDARVVRGGIEAWSQAGLPLAARTGGGS